jgi:iron complex transport system substrate-binding protein
MKTKKKIIALLEIAIVLGLLFLVALPATTIAAGEDDFVLGVYGNANEDDTIDMRDLTYVKLIFFGKKPETELADAKYDGNPRR